MSGAIGIEDTSVEVLLESMIRPQRQEMVGERFRVAHLKSARGQDLNGQMVTVTGFDRTGQEARLHCRFANGETIKLKYSNIVPLDENSVNARIQTFMASSPPISNKKLSRCLTKALRKHRRGDIDRSDFLHRLDLYRTLLDKIHDEPEKLNDADYCFPCGAGCELLERNYGLLMNQMKPGCFGNEMLDIRHIDVGLKGDNETECSVCAEVLKDDDDQILVTLPCLHVFHERCIMQWLGSDYHLGQRNTWNCPTCRTLIPNDMSTYCVNYDEQLQRRIDEYPVSGFCDKCMIAIMENNRNEELPIV